MNGSGIGRPVLIITTGGMREFVSYVRNETDAAQVTDSLRAGVTSHEVQDYAEVDPSWAMFRQFT